MVSFSSEIFCNFVIKLSLMNDSWLNFVIKLSLSLISDSNSSEGVQLNNIGIVS